MIRIITDAPEFFSDLGDVLRLFYGQLVPVWHREVRGGPWHGELRRVSGIPLPEDRGLLSGYGALSPRGVSDSGLGRSSPSIF